MVGEGRGGWGIGSGCGEKIFVVKLDGMGVGMRGC